MILREAAEEHLAEYLEIVNIEAGLQTIGRLRIDLSAETVARRAALEEIDVVPLSRYCHTASTPEGLQIGFAAVQEKEIRRGVLKLARIFKQLLAEQRQQKPAEQRQGKSAEQREGKAQPILTRGAAAPSPPRPPPA
jgi:GntR family transcriptional regulator / MocR family aminotransferase